MLLPDRVTQSVMPVAVGVHSLVKLRVKMRLLQRILVRGPAFQLLELFVRFPANGGRRGLLEKQRLSGRGRWRWRRWRCDQLTRSRTLGASQGALFLVQAVDLVATLGPNLVVLVTVVEAQVVRRGAVQTCRLRTIQGGAGTAESVIEAVAGWMTGCHPVRRRCGRVQTLGVAAVRVRVETTSDQGVGRHIAFANERVTLQNLDTGRSSENSGEQRRMIRAGCPSERRIQR